MQVSHLSLQPRFGQRRCILVRNGADDVQAVKAVFEAWTDAKIQGAKLGKSAYFTFKAEVDPGHPADKVIQLLDNPQDTYLSIPEAREEALSKGIMFSAREGLLLVTKAFEPADTIMKTMYHTIAAKLIQLYKKVEGPDVLRHGILWLGERQSKVTPKDSEKSF